MIALARLGCALGAAAALALASDARAGAEHDRPQTKTVHFVRHGERPAQSGDVGICAAGAQRAQALKRELGGKRIDAIVVSPCKRTRQTAQPLAHALGPGFRFTFASSAIDIRKKVDALPWGATAVVVTHSHLLRALVGTKLGNCEYDKLWTLTLKRDADGADWKRAAIERRSYGTLSSESPRCDCDADGGLALDPSLGAPPSGERCEL